MRVTKVKSSKAIRAKAPPPPPMPKARRNVPLAVAERPAVKRGKSEVAPSAEALPHGQFNACLRRAHQRMTAIFADVMQRYDVSPSQFEALAKLEDLGPLTQSQLERQMGLEPAELLALIGRLNRRGFVRPFPSPTDPRQILLDLSIEARTVMSEMRASAEKVAARMLAPLSPQEARTLGALLARLG